MRPSSLQSFHRYPLTHVLASSGNVRVLRLLAEQGSPLAVSQLARDAGMTPVGVRAVLATLLRQGMVTVFGQGHAQLYALNPTHPMAPPLKDLFAQERAHWRSLLDDLRAAFARLPAVQAAWLYGSTSRGEDIPGSDLDVAVALERDDGPTVESVREALHPVEDRHQVRTSVIALSPQSILARTETDAWWANLARDAQALKGLEPARFVAQLRKRAVPA
jgi:predicted nucleotidyltransferase/predicted DNA-binding transcriptional regulator